MTGKERLIELLKLLYTKTDEDHPLSTAQIVAYFVEQDVPTDRETVRDDVEVLNSCGLRYTFPRAGRPSITFQTESLSLRS